jgi:hypothetical protein
VRGLPGPANPEGRAADSGYASASDVQGDGSGDALSEQAKRWPVLLKVAVFVLILLGGLWLVAQVRQQPGTRTSMIGVAFVLAGAEVTLRCRWGLGSDTSSGRPHCATTWA